MKCLYLHGFASAFDPDGGKVQTLKKNFDVIHFSYDTTMPYPQNMARMSNIIKAHDVKIVVGCSLGGFYALEASKATGVFAVALNPSYDPKNSMKNHIGSNKNYKTGKMEALTAQAVESYPLTVNTEANGIVLIEKGDAVINPNQSFKFFEKKYATKLVAGGSHRFESLEDNIDYVLTEFEKFTK